MLHYSIQIMPVRVLHLMCPSCSSRATSSFCQWHNSRTIAEPTPQVLELADGVEDGV